MKLRTLIVIAGVQLCAQTGSVQHGITVANMDRSVKPGDDFFLYANGAWIARTEIPPDRGSVSVDTALSDISDKRVAEIIEGSGAGKMADLYHAFMDEAGIEAKGVGPLAPHLKSIAAIRDKRELARALGESMRSDVDALNNTNFHTPNLFGLWVAPGFSDSDHYAAYLLQGGLQLPDREYYLAENQHMRNLRTEYQTHVTAMLKLAGFSEAEARAKNIIDLEHAIA